MTDLAINEVSIEPVYNKNGLIGFTNFIINNDFKVCSVAIHTCPSHPTSIRLVFPVKEYQGNHLNTIFPIHPAAYECCVVAVAAAYKDLMVKLR